MRSVNTPLPIPRDLAHLEAWAERSHRGVGDELAAQIGDCMRTLRDHARRTLPQRIAASVRR